ncbi:MAG: HD domain-containing protein [bacterium]|nr:HD domain-containing protein [bacterium]
MTKKHLEKIVSLLYEAGSLRKISRAHRQFLLTNDLSDNTASHSYRTTIIGYFLAQLEKADVNKVIKICLFHDFEESRSGDQNWLNKRYIKKFDEDIINDQFKCPPVFTEIINNIFEYSQRITLESKIAKDADILDELLLLREYELQGNKEACRWLIHQEKGLITVSAKKIAEEIKTQDPHKWWWSHWTPHCRKN